MASADGPGHCIRWSPLPAALFVNPAGDDYHLLSDVAGHQRRHEPASPRLPISTACRGQPARRSTSAPTSSARSLGDYNRDGAVNAADYVAVAQHARRERHAIRGADGDGSGKIDQGDYAAWRADFGAASTRQRRCRRNCSIPEPTH